MKKIIAATAAFLLFSSTNAQNKLALKAAYNYATSVAKFADVKQPTGYKSGFGLGLLLKTEFEGVLHFSPTLMVNQRGYTITPKPGGSIAKYDNSIFYADIYPGLSFDFPLKGNEAKQFVIDFGPQISVALTGTEKTTSLSGVTTSQKMKLSTSSGYGFFDVGLNGGLGFHTPKFFAEVKYFHGLANINNEAEFDLRNIQNRVFSLGIGYYFK